MILVRFGQEGGEGKATGGCNHTNYNKWGRGDVSMCVRVILVCVSTTNLPFSYSLIYYQITPSYSPPLYHTLEFTCAILKNSPHVSASFQFYS